MSRGGDCAKVTTDDAAKGGRRRRQPSNGGLESETEEVRRRLLLVAFLASLGFFSMAAPARAQLASPPQLTSAGTWVGQVVGHGNHLDYVGSPCSIESEVCAAFIARYLIVPTTAQAFFALQSSIGENAALTGRLLPVNVGEHQGVLLVSSVS